MIVVNSNDDYYSLPSKIVKAIKYIQDLFQYDYIFKTDDDQMLYIPDFFTRLCLDLEKKIHYGGFLIDIKSDYYTNGNSHPEYNQIGRNSGLFLLKKTKYCNGRFYLLSKKVIKKCIIPNLDKAINYSVEDHFIGMCITEGF